MSLYRDGVNVINALRKVVTGGAAYELNSFDGADFRAWLVNYREDQSDNSWHAWEAISDVIDEFDRRTGNG